MLVVSPFYFCHNDLSGNDEVKSVFVSERARIVKTPDNEGETMRRLIDVRTVGRGRAGKLKSGCGSSLICFCVVCNTEGTPTSNCIWIQICSANRRKRAAGLLWSATVTATADTNKRSVVRSAERLLWSLWSRAVDQRPISSCWLWAFIM